MSLSFILEKKHTFNSRVDNHFRVYHIDHGWFWRLVDPYGGPTDPPMMVHRSFSILLCFTKKILPPIFYLSRFSQKLTSDQRSSTLDTHETCIDKICLWYNCLSFIHFLGTWHSLPYARLGIIVVCPAYACKYQVRTRMLVWQYHAHGRNIQTVIAEATSVHAHACRPFGQQFEAKLLTTRYLPSHIKRIISLQA
jgi:hypothetical protein